MHARLAKDLMHDLRGAVDDMRMRLEIGVGIDKAGQFHHPADGVERAEFVAQDRKDIDGDKAGMGARLVGAVGVTAGASAPELLVKEVVETIRGWGHDTVQESAGVEESIVFVLPKALRKE